MSKKRRTFSAEKKFSIVLKAVKGQRQISEIAAEFEVHPNQITNWKLQFLENGSAVFQKKKDTRITDMEEKESTLYKKIGEQQVEIDFLKDCQKKVGILEKRKLVDPGHKKDEYFQTAEGPRVTPFLVLLQRTS